MLFKSIRLMSSTVKTLRGFAASKASLMAFLSIAFLIPESRAKVCEQRAIKCFKDTRSLKHINSKSPTFL